jgi:hypothetical protein
VTISGTPKFFGYNVSASPLQAWWVISANDSNGANGYWNLTIATPMTAGASQCFLQGYPSITYSHYPGLNFPPDQTFKSNQCVMTESTNAVEAGTAAVGTFSGNVVEQTDSGNAPSYTLSAGSYDVIVP